MTFRFTSLLAAVIAAFPATTVVNAQQRFDGVTLRVATYGGPWKDGMQALIGAEMEQLGGQIEFVTGPAERAPRKAYCRARQGRRLLIFARSTNQPRRNSSKRASCRNSMSANCQMPSDLISPISRGGYLVPDWVFEDGVVYNADKFKELGIPAPKLYRDLLDPRLKGRVGVPDISGGLGLFVIYGFAIDAGGSETKIVAGLENMKKLGATQFFTGNPAAQTALVAGDIWANFMGSSWAIRLRRAGHNWAKFALLKVGNNVGLWERGHMGLVKGSGNVEAAHWFVNRLISPEIQLELSKRSGSVPVSKKAIAELDKDPVAHEILLLKSKRHRQHAPSRFRQDRSRSLARGVDARHVALTMRGMPHLSLQNLTKHYATVTALEGFDLTVETGELLTLLGPSGCGKTTVLRLVAGFIAPTDGQILIGGKDITNVLPNQRGIGMVFQSYALFPHLSIARNIAFGLEERGFGRAHIRKRVAELLGLIRLAEAEDRYPAELSGGQQQRVALARAVAYAPQLLLMDEPLGALDLKLREAMQLEFRRIQRELGITTLYVTHDQTEAMRISDRIAIMNMGRIAQLGTASEIFITRPSSRSVADFLGKINFFPGKVLTDRWR